MICVIRSRFLVQILCIFNVNNACGSSEMSPGLYLFRDLLPVACLDESLSERIVLQFPSCSSTGNLKVVFRNTNSGYEELFRKN